MASVDSVDRGWGSARLWRELLLIGFFVGISLVATWPLPVEIDRAPSVRPDYWAGLWNIWWMRTALFEDHTSPWFTHLLQFPNGISLVRHTLSPANALVGAALSGPLGLPTAFNLLLLAHFAFAGWAAARLVQELGGTTSAGLVAGLAYTLSPFHVYYLPQMNVGSSMGFLPLALMFMVRVGRGGGTGATAGLAASAALLATTSSYFLVYAGMLGGLVLVAGRLLGPDLGSAKATRRLLVAAAVSAGTVILVDWPRVSTLVGDAFSGQSPMARLESGRANDLLGFNWVGPPERVRVSWPSMLGYSTLALMLSGWRGVQAQPFFCLVAAVFFVLGLGEVLRIGGFDTGVPLPYALVGWLPVLDMLRKADRAHVMVQLAIAVLAGFAWNDISRRLRASWRVPAGLAIVAVLAIELAPAPLQLFDAAHSPRIAALGHERSGAPVVHLPAYPGDFVEGRYNWAQTAHRRPMPQGYTTNLTHTAAHAEAAEEWEAADDALDGGDAGPILEVARRAGVEMFILHKTAPAFRSSLLESDGTLWLPFHFVRTPLVEARQLGGILDIPVAPALLERRAEALARALGPPMLEDGLVAIFRRPGPE